MTKTKEWRPHDIAMWATPNSKRKRPVEVISRPIGDGTILVRMVPTEPTTMEEVKVADLSRPPYPCKYIQIARVTSTMLLPEDMLRYDNAALFDHTLDEARMGYGEGERRMPQEGELIYRVTELKAGGRMGYGPGGWCYPRWESFLCYVTHLHTRKLGGEPSDWQTRAQNDPSYME